jgi:hypothetical protein
MTAQDLFNFKPTQLERIDEDEAAVGGDDSGLNFIKLFFSSLFNLIS